MKSNLERKCKSLGKILDKQKWRESLPFFSVTEKLKEAEADLDKSIKKLELSAEERAAITKESMEVFNYRRYHEKFSRHSLMIFSSIVRRNRQCTIIVGNVQLLSIAIQENFRTITYRPYKRDQYNVKMNEEHERRIGEALSTCGKPVHLQEFTLELLYAHCKLQKLAAALGEEDTIIEEFKVYFQNPKEEGYTSDQPEMVSTKHMIGIARILTKVKAKKLEIRAWGFFPGSVQVLGGTLKKLENRTLRKAMLVDLSNDKDYTWNSLDEVLANNLKLPSKKREFVYLDPFVSNLWTLEEKKELLKEYSEAYGDGKEIPLEKSFKFLMLINKYHFQMRFPFLVAQCRRNLEKMKPTTILERGLHYYLRFKCFYLQQNNRAMRDMLKTLPPKKFCPITLGWIFSVATEVCFKLGDHGAMPKFADRCIAARIEAKSYKNVAMCAKNMILFFHHLYFETQGEETIKRDMKGDEYQKQEMKYILKLLTYSTRSMTTFGLRRFYDLQCSYHPRDEDIDRIREIFKRNGFKKDALISALGLKIGMFYVKQILTDGRHLDV